MAGGQTVDIGKLDATGTAYEQIGDDLAGAADNITTNVSTAQVGNAWPHVASDYADAIEKYRDSVATYGEKVGNLGGKLTKAAKSYEDGETVSHDMIASKGV